MPFTDDCSEPPDEPIVEEGRKRLRTAGLTDAQVNEWIASTRKRGGRIELVPDGLRASFVATTAKQENS